MSNPEPVTLLDYLRLSTDFLQSKSIDDARLNVEFILCHILNIDRVQLYLKFDYPLQQDEINTLRGMIKRRAKNEPLQYILGETDFYGMTLTVTPDVLIPRPETEELVDLIIKNHKGQSNLSVLDVGSGSGNITLSLAKNLPGSQVTGLDSSNQAIAIALENTKRAGLNGSVNFVHQSVFDYHPENRFDILVSNPPYVPLNDMETLQPEVRIYEPGEALTDQADGMSFYKYLAAHMNHFLKPGGSFYIECHAPTAMAVLDLFKPESQSCEIIKDLAGSDRFLAGIK